MLDYVMPMTLGVIVVGVLLSKKIKSLWLPTTLAVAALLLPTVFLYYNPPWTAFRPFGVAVCGKCIAFFERIRNSGVTNAVPIAEVTYLMALVGVMSVSALTLLYSLIMLQSRGRGTVRPTKT